MDSDELPSDLAAGIDSDQWATQGKPLEERMWDDALATVAFQRRQAHVCRSRHVADAR